jgi:predicted anti-sigma-YlaC factor YlaD
MGIIRRQHTATGSQRRHRWLTSLLILGSLAGVLSGCSAKRTVVNLVGHALITSSDVWTSDDDVELIRDALPFGLKTYESLLAASPHHRGLLLAAGSGFTQYAYAFVQGEAERLAETEIERARALQARAHKLYLRGRDYALRGLDVAHAGFTAMLRTDRTAALARTTPDDMPFLYWAGVAWAGALTAAKDDLQLLAEVSIAAALVQRVLELDETYDRGAAHEFFIVYEGSRPVAMGGSPARARAHYQRAVALSGGQRASVHVALAETVAVREQNVVEFRSLLEAALAVDPDGVPTLRLANLLAQRRARWLTARIPDLFIETDQPPGKS